MYRMLLRTLPLALLLSCASASRQGNPDSGRSERHAPPVSSSFSDVDTASISLPELTGLGDPHPLTELPRTEDNAFVLAPGFYEAEFKTYCLQPGTPAPGTNDAYFQAPLKGARRDIIETVLRNSQLDTTLDQRNVQLLLWGVVSRTPFENLPYEVQFTARRLLSSKQVFQLQGGTLGVAKTVVSAVPYSGPQGGIRQLFETGVRSYEAYERLAMSSEPSQVIRPGFTRGQWYRHPDGYYVRYFPNGYQRTKVQVYVPGSAVESADLSELVVFDPVSMVVVPANTNAQRLGVGGPVRDVIRTVIKVGGTGRGVPRPKMPSQAPNGSKS